MCRGEKYKEELQRLKPGLWCRSNVAVETATYNNGVIQHFAPNQNPDLEGPSG
jgi:hypothetical protein